MTQVTQTSTSIVTSVVSFNIETIAVVLSCNADWRQTGTTSITSTVTPTPTKYQAFRNFEENDRILTLTVATTTVAGKRSPSRAFGLL